MSVNWNFSFKNFEKIEQEKHAEVIIWNTKNLLILKITQKARPVLSDKEYWSSGSKNHMQHFVASLYQLTSPANACTYTCVWIIICQNQLTIQHMHVSICFQLKRLSALWYRKLSLELLWKKDMTTNSNFTFQVHLPLFHKREQFSSERMSLEQPEIDNEMRLL